MTDCVQNGFQKPRVAKPTLRPTVQYHSHTHTHTHTHSSPTLRPTVQYHSHTHTHTLQSHPETYMYSSLVPRPSPRLYVQCSTTYTHTLQSPLTERLSHGSAAHWARGFLRKEGIVIDGNPSLRLILVAGGRPLLGTAVVGGGALGAVGTVRILRLHYDLVLEEKRDHVG